MRKFRRKKKVEQEGVALFWKSSSFLIFSFIRPILFPECFPSSSFSSPPFFSLSGEIHKRNIERERGKEYGKARQLFIRGICVASTWSCFAVSTERNKESFHWIRYVTLTGDRVRPWDIFLERSFKKKTV